LRDGIPSFRRPADHRGQSYRSRLLTGTGKFKDFDETRRATDAAGAQIVTVALRRVNLGQDKHAPNLLDVLPPDQFTILPNTAGCYSADDAVRTCQLARELLDGHKLVKLEVLGDEKTLFPDVVQTLAAAERLVADGFDVMVYTSDDPILARRLEAIGCVAVMPLAAPIGSGPGHPEQVEPAGDHREREGAGAGRRRRGHRLDAAIAMELGCDGVLMNTAIAGAKDPVRMARAMKLAVQAGRDAFLAGTDPAQAQRQRLVSRRRPVLLSA
jgi:thiazole synthase